MQEIKPGRNLSNHVRDPTVLGCCLLRHCLRGSFQPMKRISSEDAIKIDRRIEMRNADVPGLLPLHQRSV